MDNKKKNEKNKESWKLWDSIFFSGFFGLLHDNEEARHDEKKFKLQLWGLLFSILFAVALFGISYWIVVNKQMFD